MRCWYRETRFECGDYLDVALYPVYTKSVVRAKKAKPTSETQQKLNDTLAENKLIRIANANFTEDDIKLDLTYIEDYHPESDEDPPRNPRCTTSRSCRTGPRWPGRTRRWGVPERTDRSGRQSA